PLACGKLPPKVLADFGWLKIQQGTTSFEMLNEDFASGVRRCSCQQRRRQAAYNVPYKWEHFYSTPQRHWDKGPEHRPNKLFPKVAGEGDIIKLRQLV